MKIEIRTLQNNIKMIILSGHVDESTIGEVQKAFETLFRTNYEKIICDMKKVEHISAPVLKTFIENIQTARARGGDVKLYNVLASIKNIFRYAGFNDDTVFIDNLDKGIEALRNFVPSNKVDDPFGATIPSNSLYSPTIQGGQSPLKSNSEDDPYQATFQMPTSPLQKNRADEKELYEATIQMSGSPLQSAPANELKKKQSDKQKPGQADKSTEAEVKRKSTIRFYKQMYPFCIFPLKVIFSKQKIQDTMNKKITQLEGKKEVAVSKEKPTIKVVPHLPGCLVIPPYKKLDITPDISHANFSVTPLAECKKQKGYVEIYYNNELIDTVDELGYRVQKQTLAKIALYMSVISTSLDFFQIDFGNSLPQILQKSSEFAKLLGEKAGLGAVLAGVFLLISVIFYFLRRPREAKSIENILPVNE